MQLFKYTHTRSQTHLCALHTPTLGCAMKKAKQNLIKNKLLQIFGIPSITRSTQRKRKFASQLKRKNRRVCADAILYMY